MKIQELPSKEGKKRLKDGRGCYYTGLEVVFLPLMENSRVTIFFISPTVGAGDR